MSWSPYHRLSFNTQGCYLWLNLLEQVFALLSYDAHSSAGGLSKLNCLVSSSFNPCQFSGVFQRRNIFKNGLVLLTYDTKSSLCITPLEHVSNTHRSFTQPRENPSQNTIIFQQVPSNPKTCLASFRPDSHQLSTNMFAFWPVSLRV